MKIGILTVHRAINVGAVLQCYALQETLKSLGHEVWVINYVQEKVERTDRPVYSLQGWFRLLGGLHFRSFICYWKEWNKKRKAYHNFDSFLDNYLHCTSPCDERHIPQDFDVYVIGSDQLWNSNIFGYNEKVYWGNFNHPIDSKLVAYAPSTSVRNLEETGKEFVSKSLSKFDMLAVREKSVEKYLNSNFQVKNMVETVLDPTLLVNPTIWKNIEGDKYAGKKYVCVYEARPCRGQFGSLWKKAKILADKMGCDIINFELYKHSPLDYLDIIRHASCVMTSSFHGVVFSLIYNRPLIAVKYGDEQDERYVDLLRSVGAEDMLVNFEHDRKE